MTPVDVDELPGQLKTLATAGRAVGWEIRATRAEDFDRGVRRKVDGRFVVLDEPITTIVVRFLHAPYAAYGCWRVDGGVRWRQGCANRLPPGRFDTLAGLKRYLGVT